jgi:predicted Zn-dependent protease with MMP-like domain
VQDALGTIPQRFRRAMKNLAIVVEDEPAADLLAEMAIEPPDTLLGLYQGIPLTERRWDYGNALPDRILLFQGPLERESDDDADLVVAIGETLIHEVGHYFGLSEEERSDRGPLLARGRSSKTSGCCRHEPQSQSPIPSLTPRAYNQPSRHLTTPQEIWSHFLERHD